MKINPRPLGLIVFLLFVIFTILAALTINHYAAAPGNLDAGALYSQIATPTEVVEDVSEIGSTDGIVLMGVVIVLIVVVPILLQRKNWRSN
jgi:hypothetical protein